MKVKIYKTAEIGLFSVSSVFLAWEYELKFKR